MIVWTSSMRSTLAGSPAAGATSLIALACTYSSSGHFANCRAAALYDLHAERNAAAGRSADWCRHGLGRGDRTRPTQIATTSTDKRFTLVLSAAADGKVSAVHGADSPHRRRSGRAGEHRPHAPLGRLHGAGRQHRRGRLRGGEGGGFDVVLSDMRMPGLSGIDVLRKLRDVRVDASFIIMTGFGTVETRGRSHEARRG